MKKTIIPSCLSCLLMICTATVQAQNETVSELMNKYKSQGVTTTSVAQGKALWLTKFTDKKSLQIRSCTNCHGIDLRQAGKHIKTGKAIKMLAPSINTNRLTEIKKIKKWLKRNCKWTLGRECSAQEKADLLSYISSQ